MAVNKKVFLDTNVYVDILKRKNFVHKNINSYSLYISPFSTLVLFYSYKISVPNKKLYSIRNKFSQVPITSDLMEKSLLGPTSDIEDNLQLHSAVLAECKYFLTRDEDLLSMKKFGKLKIVDKIM